MKNVNLARKLYCKFATGAARRCCHWKNMLSILALSLLPTITVATNHAVLVAGSNTFANYRHQADLCRVYHLLLKNGYEADNIITMAYGDVEEWNTTTTQDPAHGELWTSPTSGDWWEGCELDYSGDDVTPENYMAVLTGDESAVNGKPVLTSSSDDKVFLFFVDHGGVGSLCFPSSDGKTCETMLYERAKRVSEETREFFSTTNPFDPGTRTISSPL